MSEIERKKIDELVTRYSLEPSIIDIYVEGIKDKIILEWYLDEHEIKDVNVYQIEGIEIYAEERYNNNKGRIIVLCRRLNDELGQLDEKIHYLGIVDKDRDHYLGNITQIRNLKYTGYTSLQLYLTNDETLRKFYRLTLNLEYTNVKLVFSDILKRLFLLRVVNESLNLNFTLINIYNLINIIDGEIEFDFEEYFIRLLNSNELFDRQEEIEEELEQFESILEDSFNQTVNYHDFIKVFSYYLRTKKNRDEFEEKVLEASLMGTVESSYLNNFDFFQNLLSVLD